MRWWRSPLPVLGGLLAAACGPGPSLGQAPETPARPPAASAGGSESVADLATRFRFSERYGTEERAGPEALGPYRVAIRDTYKFSVEKPQGAPDRHEATYHTIYTERAARVGPTGGVLAAVRRYDAYRRTPEAAAKPSRRRPLVELTLWFQPREGKEPQILSLTEGRGLREDEYNVAVRQLFLPDLAAVLPTLPVRIGDRWVVSAAGARTLLGMLPVRGGEPLSATLGEVRRAAEGTNWEAVIGVTGRAKLPSSDIAVNARAVFSFPPPPADAEPASGKDRAGAGGPSVEARGAVVDLRMSTSTISLLAPNSRLRQVVVRELVVGRQLAVEGPVPAIPDPPPSPDEANSWLTYDDPQDKYHFRYPQDFQQGNPPTEFLVSLVRPRPNGPDTVELQLQVKTGDAEADRRNRDPEFHLQMIQEQWRQDRYDVIRGPRGWLPDADWAPSKKRVYRMEAALRGGGAAHQRDLRVHRDDYLVLFSRDESLVVTSNTVQDPPGPFRKEVEQIIKSFDFGPSEAR